MSLVRLDPQLASRFSHAGPRPIADVAVADLLQEDLSPLRFFVHGLLPEGATLLFSPGKIGKSFFAGALALSVASGRTFFGYRTSEAGVEYLDLEPNRVMSQGRWDSLRQGNPIPANLRTVWSWPRMDRGGLDQLARLLDAHPSMGLVVIDVLSLFWPESNNFRGNSFHAEYEIYSKLNHFAMERHIAILMIHHVSLGRSRSKDPFERASGTAAALAGPNASWYLERKRGSSSGCLHVTGRCVPEAKIELLWEPRFGGWSAAL